MLSGFSAVLCVFLLCCVLHGIEEKRLEESKSAQHSHKMLGRADKMLSIAEKCLVGQKNVQHRAEKPLRIGEKCLVEPESA